MGWGSAGTPAWQDDKTIDEEKQKKKASAIEALQKENAELKKQVKELESALKKLKKQ